jgi:hypothetical protein
MLDRPLIVTRDIWSFDIEKIFNGGQTQGWDISAFGRRCWNISNVNMTNEGNRWDRTADQAAGP